MTRSCSRAGRPSLARCRSPRRAGRRHADRTRSPSVPTAPAARRSAQAPPGDSGRRTLAAFHLRDLNFVGTASPAGIDGVYIGNDLAGTGKLSYIRCTNLDISGYGRNGLSLYGGETSGTRVGFTDVILDGVVVHGNCTLDQVSSAGIRVKGVYGYNVNGTPSHTNVTLRNCVAYDNLGWAGASSGWTGTGIVLAEVQTALVELCVAYNNGENCPIGAVGIFTYNSDQVTIQYCESYRNRSAAARGRRRLRPRWRRH